jgi:hypothetical protein
MKKNKYTVIHIETKKRSGTIETDNPKKASEIRKEMRG